MVTPALISMTPASAGTRVLATKKISGVATTWEPAGLSSQVLEFTKEETWIDFSSELCDNVHVFPLAVKTILWEVFSATAQS